MFLSEESSMAALVCNNCFSFRVFISLAGMLHMLLTRILIKIYTTQGSWHINKWLAKFYWKILFKGARESERDLKGFAATSLQNGMMDRLISASCWLSEKIEICIWMFPLITPRIKAPSIESDDFESWKISVRYHIVLGFRYHRSINQTYCFFKGQPSPCPTPHRLSEQSE